MIERISGKSLTVRAVEAGYSGKNPAQSGHQAMENIKAKAPELFGRHGRDDDTFIEKIYSRRFTPHR